MTTSSPNNSNKKQHDPFLDLEDETDKNFHILQQLRDRHRTLLSQVPEAANATGNRLRPMPTASSSSSSALDGTGSSGRFKPGDLNWPGASYAVLCELDDICEEALDRLNDLSEDVALLRATVDKHVAGDIGTDHENVVLSGDEVARREEAVLRFERKLIRARSDTAEMSKFRDFRQMQITPSVYRGADGGPAATPQQKGGGGRGGLGSGNNNDPSAAAAAGGRPQNEFAANFVRQELAEQERLSAQHGEILTQIHVGVLSAEQKAKIINQQLKESNEKLTMVERQIDTIQGKLDSAVQATHKLLENTSDRHKFALICCLTTVLVLLLFGLFSGTGVSAK